MKALKIYKGVGLGDIVKVNAELHTNKKLAKVLRIYKKNSDIRFVIRMAGGLELDVDETQVMFSDNQTPCHCRMIILLREGCLCGGV
jgi:hypothetical protein